MEFDFATFVAYLVQNGNTPSVAEKYAIYVRASVNAGQDPADNERYAAHVATFASSTRSRRRTAWRHYQRFVGADILPTAPVKAAEPGLRDLTAFTEWLHVDRGLAPSATTAYASTIRTALRAVGENPTRDELEGYLDTRSQSYRARFPTVWRYWRDFVQGEAVNLDESPQAVPDVIAFAAWSFATRIGMRLAHLRELRWADLRELEDGSANVRYLPDPQPGRYYRENVSSDLLAALRAWSLPHDDTAPVFPSAQGGTVAMTRREIHDTVTHGAELVAQGYQPTQAGPGERARPAMRVPWNSDVQDIPTPWKPETDSMDFGEKIEG